MTESGGFKPRRFQREFRAICSDIRDGSLFPVGAAYGEPELGMTRMPPRIVLEVAAGAGKSNLAPILAAELLGRRVDAICWLVPRLTLQSQAEESFEDEELRGWLGHAYEIRQSTNEVDPCRGKAGWASTHQAIEQNVIAAMQEFSRGKRYALFIDEAHHVQLDGSLHRSLRSLVERAEVIVLMSGMLQRGDRKKIGFLRYKPMTDPKGRPVEVWDDASDRAGGYVVVRYPILDALRERAIKPLEFYYYDAKLGWSTSEGDSKTIDTFDEVNEDDLSAAIGTALQTHYAHEVMEQAVDHWDGHRAINPGAKILVVAKGIPLAKDYVSYLKKTLGVRRIGIATTEAPEEALVAIGKFKRNHDDPYALDCLVTVAMAYEGLNVPQVTHVVALTHIRSTPWIYQMLSRANRIDRKRTDCEPHQQYGFAFAPRDKRFMKCAAVIRSQQDQYIYESTEGPGPGTPPPLVWPDFGNRNDRATVEDLGSFDKVADDRMKKYEGVLRQGGYWGQIPLIVLDRAVTAANEAERGETPPPSAAPAPQPTPAAAPPRPGSKAREAKLRTEIQELCAKLDALTTPEGETPAWGTWNGLVIRKYGKSRTVMWEPELEACKAWLTGEYEERRVKVDVS